MKTEITYKTAEGINVIFETTYPSFKIIVRSASGFDVDTGYLEQNVVLSDISHKLKRISIDEYVHGEIIKLVEFFYEHYGKQPEEVLLKEIPVI